MILSVLRVDKFTMEVSSNNYILYLKGYISGYFNFTYFRV